MLSPLWQRRRPAAASRRSFLFWAGWGFAALLVAAPLTVRAFQPPPPWSLEPLVRQRVTELLAQVRERSPAAARRIEAARALAETASAARPASPPWERHRWPVEERWSVTLALAMQAQREGIRAERATFARWQELSPAVFADLARARAEVRDPGLGRVPAQALQQAEVLASLASRYAANRDYARASETLAAVGPHTAKVHGAWLRLHSRFADPGLRREWQQMVDQTLAEAGRCKQPAIVVSKLERRLDVYQGGQLRASFVAELGANGLRRKQHSGDRATPEGRYRVTEVRNPGQTKFYKALMLDYPNTTDLLRFRLARRQGEIPGNVGPGNLIEIHGEGGMGKDWTDGCVALTNADMDRLFALAGRVGVAVTIVGTHQPPPGPR